jgi:uncharacterized protein (DUF2235 family)
MGDIAMKNIVLCFDGTWNTADAQFPTNVVKTAQLVLPADANGASQVVFYDEGVGSGRVAFAASINSLLGGAFGVGLMNNIEQAYRFLTFNYEPGDKIFIFGFSRGAFSARSFGGLIRTCGVLQKRHVGKVRQAIALYQNRDRQAGADAQPCVEFRRDYSFAAYRSTGGGSSASTQTTAGEHPLAIEYVGIWDTVGALGVPSGFLFANSFNKKYQFHDLALSSMVKNARHALSIDERRRTFVPTPWTNIGELNREATGSASNRAGPPYLQQWFPGDHASVGGGGDVNGLWQATLVWVVEGAQACGLAIDPAGLEEYRDDIDYTVSVYCMKKPTFSLSSLSLRRWRDGPGEGDLSEVSEIAQRRLRAPATSLFERRPYRPRTLRAVINSFIEGAGGKK